ncbi:Os04g0678250, partial [Oryza sativa Japonica Group]
HADAADNGRGHGGGVAGLGEEEVVELGEERGEEGEGGAGGEHALAQHRAARWPANHQRAVLGVVRVPHRPRQQAQLRDHEREPV